MTFFERIWWTGLIVAVSLHFMVLGGRLKKIEAHLAHIGEHLGEISITLERAWPEALDDRPTFTEEKNK